MSSTYVLALTVYAPAPPARRASRGPYAASPGRRSAARRATAIPQNAAKGGARPRRDGPCHSFPPTAAVRRDGEAGQGKAPRYKGQVDPLVRLRQVKEGGRPLPACRTGGVPPGPRTRACP